MNWWAFILNIPFTRWRRIRRWHVNKNMDVEEVFGMGKKYLHVAYEVGEQNKASYADKHAEQILTAKGACNKTLPIRTAHESIIEQTISTTFKSGISTMLMQNCQASVMFIHTLTKLRKTTTCSWKIFTWCWLLTSRHGESKCISRDFTKGYRNVFIEILGRTLFWPLNTAPRKSFMPSIRGKHSWKYRCLWLFMKP